MDDILKAIGTIVTAIGVVILIFLLEPFLLFWCGWLAGWLAEIVIGQTLINSINMIFKTTFTVDSLPWIGATLGWIGSFFRSSSKSKK